MMASGEIRLSDTTMRQMPVLAQSQSVPYYLVPNSAVSVTGAYYSAPTDQIVASNPGETLDAADSTGTFISTIGDFAEAVGAGGPKSIGGVGIGIGVAASSFQLGAGAANMYQQGPTVQNITQVSVSTFNLALTVVLIAQPETAPIVGAIFLGEVFVNVLVPKD
jgi:hypothetical protein